MSREVPLDRALSDEDRRYLRQLGSAGDNMERRLDAQYPPDAEELAAFEREHRKYLAKMNGAGATLDEQNALQDENARLRAELAALQDQLAAANPGVPSYTGWKKAELEAEIDRVNAEDPEAKLEKGLVQEMVERLTAYFATE